MQPIMMNLGTAKMLHDLSQVPRDKLALRHDPHNTDGRLCTACATIAWVHVQNIVTEAHSLQGGVMEKFGRTVEYLADHPNLKLHEAESMLLMPLQDDVLGPASFEMSRIVGRFVSELTDHVAKWEDRVTERRAQNNQLLDGGGDVPS